MFVIQTIDVANILSIFHCDSSVCSIDLVAHYQVDEKVVMIIKATTLSDEYILKFCSDTVADIQKENQQCEFSEFLFAAGVSLPHKYAADGKYVVNVKLAGQFFLVTVEDVFGEDVRTITEKSATELGRMLGRIHKASIDNDYHLPTGIAYTSLFSSRIEYDSVWDSAKIPFVDYQHRKDTKERHNEAIATLRSLWKDLPVYAVHGDLALTSNMMYDEKKGYGIIDFNLSGDEILLGDLLITWYSSRYSEPFVKQVLSHNILKIRQAFFSGYFDVCSLHESEIDIFERSSKIVNGLFFSKFVACKSVKNNADSVDLYAKIIDNFDRFDFLDCANVLINYFK